MDTVQLIYLIMALVGFLIILFSFIFDHDHGMDHDFDHDVDAGDTMSPSVFSLKVIACFLMGFGLGASISHSWLMNELFDGKALLAVDLIFGAVLGFAVGWIGWLIIKIFLSQQGSYVFSTDKFVGLRSTLRLGIVENGIGELTCTIDGVQRTLDVRSFNGQPIAKGSLVEILSLDGSTGVVRPVLS